MKRNRHLTVKGELKDRGRIKWTAMMLPEHVEMLREWRQESSFGEKPILDEFDLEAIHEEILLAHRRKCSTELRVWRGQPVFFRGVVETIDLSSKVLLLQTETGVQRLLFDEITGAQTLD